MKTIQTLAIAATAILVGLTSCKQEPTPDTPVVAQQKSVFLKLENAPQLASRSDSESALSEKAVLTKGVIVFVNGEQITRYVNIATTGDAGYTEPDDSQVPTIQISELTAGVNFAGINANKVYVIGNRVASELVGLPTQDSEGKIPMGTKMIDVIKNASSLLEVTDAADMADGVHADAPMFGVSMLVKDAVGEAYTAEVELTPIMARLEIKEIKATDVTFDLNGIFVNNYYTEAQVDGLVPVGTALQNNASTVASYVQAYHATALRDWSGTSLGTKQGDATAGFSVKPTDVWGYNVFQAKNIIAADKNLPRIVLRMSDVRDKNNIELTDIEGAVVDKFITVNRFLDSGSAPITEFKAGYVYTITEISFDKSKLTEEPELADRVVTAKVKVSVLEWVDGGSITPEI